MSHVRTTQHGSTDRIRHLLESLRKRGLSDRSGEWFRKEMFREGIGASGEPIIVRTAMAFREMLEAMVDPANSTTTHTYEIEPGELIVGVIPMGSVGLGKTVPSYLSDEEKRVAFFTSRDASSTFGHNCPDHQRVLSRGLSGIIDHCQERLAFLQIDTEHPLGDCEGLDKKIAFYRAVVICCKAVTAYARAFAKLAADQAAEESNPARKAELREVARICRKVPNHPAETLHEALQSIFFVHLALHATGNLNSVGRLDQLIQPYLEASLRKGEVTEARAVELLECFLIKCAGRLNLTPAYLEKQDHLDFATGLGTSPVFLDQIASANNFLQNVVVGGLTPDGKDATCQATYLVLKACASAGLPTPTINVRLHVGSPPELVKAVAETLVKGSNGLPIVYNDDTIIPAFRAAGLPDAIANDYVVDGCWEPILNAKGDWTFGMVNMLTVLECALNSGALLSNNPSTLRGTKKSFATPTADQIQDFDQLLGIVAQHLGYFVDQVALGLYRYYALDASVTPTPFLSSLLGACLEKGIDKTWGGADFNLGGVIATAVPNCANSLASIRKWVFQERKYTLPEVVRALKANFGKGASALPPDQAAYYDTMWKDFRAAPKFGNDDPAADDLMRHLLDIFHSAVLRSEAFADEVFLADPKTAKERERITSLRALCGYEGPSMKARFGKSFDLTFTAGCGTFGQYAFMGQGINASAEARYANDPLTPNCSPIPGTVQGGLGHLLASTAKLGTDRFAAGMVFDVCVDAAPDNQAFVEQVVKGFILKRGNIMTVSVASLDELKTIADLCTDVRAGKSTPDVLEPYCTLGVRVGGWNAPFVTFSAAQQQNYLNRVKAEY